MSFDEYEVLEHPFGWKVEYWDGQAQFTPREMGVTTRIDLKTFSSQRQLSPQQYTLIPVSAAYTEQMIDGYFEAFADSVEFCNWPIREIQSAAERGISRYFKGYRGNPLPASVIALEPSTQRLVGLALFILKAEQKPHLDLLYVRSPHKRKGIATVMLHRGITHLLAVDASADLFSAYHVCNHQSRQWHHKLGFQDVYDPYYIRIRWGWLKHEIWRREKLGMSIGLDDLRQERDKWESQLEWPYV